MSQPAGTIRRHTSGGPAPAFDRLRAKGLHWLQEVGGERWTDHNLHDPGITLLEQLCFALTDLSYRADFPVADHLTGPDGRIDYEALSLPPPSTIFPCRATTAQDYRRLLVDAVPGIDDAVLESVPDAHPAGVYRLKLKLAPGDAQSESRRIALARAAFRRERNLCEDLADEVARVHDVFVELLGEIDLAGPRDPVDVLAEVYDRCARFVARVPRSIGYDEALQSGRTLREVYTGPRTRRGVPLAEPDAPPVGDLLFLADLSALVRRIDGVAHAHLRALRIRPADDAGIVSPASAAGAGASSLEWSGEDWSLRLRVPLDPHDGSACLGVKYRGHDVTIDRDALRLRYADLQAGDLGQRLSTDEDPPPHDLAGLPRGRHRPAAGYRSVESDFPATYHLGRNGLPPSASAQDLARLRQFKGYLRLFDHVIANGMAQVSHLRELFSLDGGSARSYWQQGVLQEDGGISDALLLDSPEAVLDKVHAPFDRSADRKSRVLDHLLALHGVTYRQDSMRKFGNHLDADELESWLLENKAEYLRDIVVLGRDRAGGADYSRAAWDDPGNTPGLQQRASLQLGWRLPYARKLSSVLQRQRITMPAAADDEGSTLLAPEQLRNVRRIGRVAAGSTREQMQADLQRIAPLRSRVLPAALLRAGVRHDLYALIERRAERGIDASCDLLLGPDEAGRWWQLGEFAEAATASRAAGNTRRFLRHLSESSEGMHVVEHVLLRPVGSEGLTPSMPQPGPEFYALRLTVFLPAWTARTHRPAFRRFAEETLRANCPAHLALECRWLEYDALQQFESDLEGWMRAKASYCRALDEKSAALAERAVALDRCARQIVVHIGTGQSVPSYEDLGAPGHA